MRVEFCCGRRALQDYREKNEIVDQLSNQLTTSATAVIPAVHKLQETQKAQQKELKKLHSQITHLEANHLREQAEPLGETGRLITHIYDGDTANPAHLRAVANQITAADDIVVLLGLTGKRSHLLFARGKNAPGDMQHLIKQSLPLLDGGGGGSASLAQGGGGPADDARMTAVLTHSKQVLQSQVK
jgi:alanyl-tRNA synthetase